MCLECCFIDHNIDEILNEKIQENCEKMKKCCENCFQVENLVLFSVFSNKHLCRVDEVIVSWWFQMQETKLKLNWKDIPAMSQNRNAEV